MARRQFPPIVTRTGSGSTISASWDQATLAGSTLLAAVAVGSAAATAVITPPAGWTALGPPVIGPTWSGVMQAFRVYNATSRTGAEVFDLGGGSRDAALALLEYTGLDGLPEDKKASAFGESTSPTSGTTAATTKANQVALAWIANRNVDLQGGVPVGWAKLGEATSASATVGNRVTLAIYEQVRNAVGTVGLTVTLPLSRPYLGEVVALNTAVVAAVGQYFLQYWDEATGSLKVVPLVVKAPNGTHYRINVSNTGALTAEVIT